MQMVVSLMPRAYFYAHESYEKWQRTTFAPNVSNHLSFIIVLSDFFYYTHCSRWPSGLINP